MHKLRSLARRGSGRVVPSSTQRPSSKNRTSSSLSPQEEHTQPAEGDTLRVIASGSTRALALLGKKIFGYHRHYHSEDPVTSTPESSGKARRHGSLNLLGGYSGRSSRIRRGHEKNVLSGGTSLMDMQAYVHVKRATATEDGVWYEEGSDVALEWQEGRRPVEEVLHTSSDVSFVLVNHKADQVVETEGEMTTSTASLWFSDAAGQSRTAVAGNQEAPPPLPTSTESSSPPTPRLRRSLTVRPTSPRPSVRQRAITSVTRSSSSKVGRKIINHKDLDLVVIRGDYARRSRRPYLCQRSPKRSKSIPIPQIARPIYPVTPDVLIAGDMVQRNRGAALDALMGRKSQDLTALAAQSESMSTEMMRELEEDDSDDTGRVVVATIRARMSLPDLLQLAPPPVRTTLKTSRSTRARNVLMFSQLMNPSGPPIRDAPSEASGLDSSQGAFPLGLFPLPPTTPEAPKLAGTKRARTKSSPDLSLAARLATGKFRKSQEKERDCSSSKRLPVTSSLPLHAYVPGARPWKLKDLEKLPCIEPADRIAGVVRWVADVREALDMESVPVIEAPPPYVPYWLNC